MRCDTQSGYMYDANVYAGKDGDGQSGPMGDKVVKTIVSAIQDSEDVTLAFDRFFLPQFMSWILYAILIWKQLSNLKKILQFSKKNSAVMIPNFYAR